MKDQFKYFAERTLESIEELAKHRNVTIYYAMNTCWWGTSTYHTNKPFPTGPRGEGLLQTDDAAGFIAKARANPKHYGKHGLRAFVAALDGNVRLTNFHHASYPWSFRSWDTYNRLLDDGEAFESNVEE